MFSMFINICIVSLVSSQEPISYVKLYGISQNNTQNKIIRRKVQKLKYNRKHEIQISIELQNI